MIFPSLLRANSPTRIFIFIIALLYSRNLVPWLEPRLPTSPGGVRTLLASIESRRRLPCAPHFDLGWYLQTAHIERVYENYPPPRKKRKKERRPRVARRILIPPHLQQTPLPYHYTRTHTYFCCWFLSSQRETPEQRHGSRNNVRADLLSCERIALLPTKVAQDQKKKIKRCTGNTPRPEKEHLPLLAGDFDST